MECEWKQGQYHRAKIIERRKRSDAPDYEYYVHYIGCKFHTPFTFLHIMLLQHSTHAPTWHLFGWIAVYNLHGILRNTSSIGQLVVAPETAPLVYYHGLFCCHGQLHT